MELWNGEGQIVLTQFNSLGELECLYVNIQIEEIQPVDIQDDQSETLFIYPNPAGSQLNILTSSKIAEAIYIYDVSGKIIYSQEDPSLNEFGVLVVDLGDVRSGIYFLTLRTSEGVLVEKVSVER